MVPSILLYVGLEFLGEPWILVLVIHWVVMLAIPWFIVEILKCYGHANISYGLNHFGRTSDLYGLIIATVLALVTVGLYWLFCGPLGIDLKGVLSDAPIPDDTLLKILAIAYFIIVKPYIEEWFWRRYNYDIFPYYELDFWLVSFFFSLTYTVLAINIGVEIIGALIVCVVFTCLGRLFISMTWEHGVFVNYITHVGICAGVVVCYFLADAGKF